MIIKNREELISSALRARAVELIETGIARVLPTQLMRSSLSYVKRYKRLVVEGRRYSHLHGRIFVIGGGKASGMMAEEFERIVGPDNIEAGFVNCKSTGYQTSKITLIQAGHPVPDEAGVRGVRNMLALKARYSMGKDDLVVCLISGGGSALMPCPVPDVTLEDKQQITQLLLSCGADINEINTVRKHLSLTKGGNLGQFYAPSRVVSLLLSDVVGDDPSSIASGPTVPDPSTFQDALAILKKYGLLDKAPPNTMLYIQRGAQDMQAETPKELFNCSNHVIGRNIMALEAMAEKARDMGLKPLILTAEQKGDTEQVAREHARAFIDGKYRGFNVVLIGGETTPSLPANAGQGGRNQHFAAASMLAMQDYTHPWACASAGTDGSDYLADVAGAMVDDRSLGAARAAGLDVESFIKEFDSNTLFQKMGRSLIITGPTGTNVSDVMLYLFP